MNLFTMKIPTRTAVKPSHATSKRLERTKDTQAREGRNSNQFKIQVNDFNYGFKNTLEDYLEEWYFLEYVSILHKFALIDYNKDMMNN